VVVVVLVVPRTSTVLLDVVVEMPRTSTVSHATGIELSVQDNLAVSSFVPFVMRW
jgi:hypothetical protein